MANSVVPAPGGQQYQVTGMEYAEQDFGGPPPKRGSAGVDQVMARTIAALKRYKWLIVAIFAVGSATGVALTRFVRPKFAVNGTVWIAQNQAGAGPVQAPGLIQNDLGWPDLVKSFTVLDQVVSQLALYVTPEDERDANLFRSLLPTDSLTAGAYRLTLNDSKTSYRLTRLREQRGDVEAVVDSGVVGDSIGRNLGFSWAPDPKLFRRGTEYDFEVVTPREAALKLQQELAVIVPLNSNLMSLSLQGEKPELTAATMNTVLRRFEQEATRLKKANLIDVANTVDEQLRNASNQLTEAERSLESFKINTITEPNENVAISPGVSIATNPTMAAFFNDRGALESARSDRQQLERIMAESASRGGRLSAEALRGAPGLLTNGPTGAELAAALNDLTTKESALRTYLQTYTEEYAPVKRLQAEIRAIETATVPRIAAKLLAEYREREGELNRRIDRASGEIKKIPQRTIEEQRRVRAVAVATTIFQDLQNRAVVARLSEKTVMPDVAILDTAVAPRRPTSDTTLGLIALSVLASLVVGMAIAILLDRRDGRFRYPEQATGELGLEIVGAIPSYSAPRSQRQRLEQASQMVESFRALALSVRSAFPTGTPVQLTVSSPGPGDGKSTISINLANALAEGGYRTVLVDGDIRRGHLHESCPPATQVPGLLEYLAGEATLAEVIKPTDLHVNISLIPCGSRRRQGPELLASQRMAGLLRELRSQFDAIVVDCAPLAAGIDAYAMGAATGSMLLVLRAGETDRRLARAKLETLDRLPIRIIGTVLNDIGESTEFRYYHYLEGYGATEEPEVGLIGAGESQK